ncbi:c-type cytochrome [Flavobacterium aquiphilum]|uniref:c-type cytochrome n=1 Tax=Flavobacterium aquiphilum TaxID=3003261 RepID=UPI00247FD3A3|nr:c-type cytochrome [Flavobacterium aquiphilum]
MKKIVFLFAVLSFLSCKKESQEPFGKPEETAIEAKTPEALGKEIFEGKGNCVACHQVDQKVVGPSIQEIAKIYKEKNGDIVTFLKGDSKPLVDPSQFEVMKTNFAITEEMSDEELEALEAYISSNLK